MINKKYYLLLKKDKIKQICYLGASTYDCMGKLLVT